MEFNYFVLQKVNQFINKVIKVILNVVYSLYQIELKRQ